MAKNAKPNSKRIEPKSNSLIPSIRTKQDLTRELYAVWTEFMNQETWVPADRWISGRVRQNRFTRLERIWISSYFLAALRFANFALFCEHGALPESPKTALQSLPPHRFFFWIEQRLKRITQITSPLFKGKSDPERMGHFNRLTNSANADSLAEAVALNGLPGWCEPYLQRRIDRSGWNSEQRNRFLGNHAVPAPLWIRAGEKLTPEELKKESFAIHSRIGSAWEISGPRHIFTTDSYKSGKFDVQDAASQMIGKAVVDRAENAVHIWDCCAGNGGKTIQIATQTEHSTIRVSDINDRKLVRIHERAEQFGVTKRIAYVPWDGTVIPTFHHTIAERGGFDIVLIDAPCSGSGTWRNNPDGRILFSEEKLNELLTIQKNLLELASQAVRPGGWLIYGTCSWFVEENEDQVDRFCRGNSGFRLEEMNLCGSPQLNADTTFFAAMKRS